MHFRLRSITVTCESLVSREFSRIILQFHFSISRHLNFTFTSWKEWNQKSFHFSREKRVKFEMLSLFSRNEKWNDFWFHSFREVKVKLKCLEIEIEKWNCKIILENSRETRLSQVTAHLFVKFLIAEIPTWTSKLQKVYRIRLNPT